MVALAFSASAFAQQARPMPAAPQNAKPAAPAPRHDISGVWAGPVLPRREPVPAMTPWAQALFDANQPFGGGAKAVGVGASNDPLVMCDPLGFPRNMLYETRGFEFEQTPKKMLELLQYQRIWREIWTDGRKLPTNAGGSELDAPDPRFYGYSVGHWDDDYTFVIETTGLDERSWLDEFGHPHSVNMHVEERYRRVDQDTLEVTINIDDPKAYVKPFEVMKQLFHWNPKQEFEEQLCVPSEAQEYLKTLAAPAAHK
jgi:hypothetical protein